MKHHFKVWFLDTKYNLTCQWRQVFWSQNEASRKKKHSINIYAGLILHKSKNRQTAYQLRLYCLLLLNIFRILTSNIHGHLGWLNRAHFLSYIESRILVTFPVCVEQDSNSVLVNEWYIIWWMLMGYLVTYWASQCNIALAIFDDSNRINI